MSQGYDRSVQQAWGSSDDVPPLGDPPVWNRTPTASAPAVSPVAPLTSPAYGRPEGGPATPAEYQPGSYGTAEYQPGSYGTAEYQSGSYGPTGYQSGSYGPAGYQPGPYRPAEYQPGPYESTVPEPAAQVYQAPPEPQPIAGNMWHRQREVAEAQPDPEGPTPTSNRDQEYVAAQVRSGVITRMKLFNTMHAMNAWESRRSRPLGPHILAFLYAVQDRRSRTARPYYAIRAAWRLWSDGDDVQQLVPLLHTQAKIAWEDYLAGGAIFDPLRQMTQSGGDEIPEEALYIGLAVSSLDTPAGTWKQTQKRATAWQEVPGRIMVVLTDETRLIVDRPGESHLPLQVYSSKSLLGGGNDVHQSWRELRDSQLDPPSWEGLDRLHQAVVEGQERMASASSGRH